MYFSVTVLSSNQSRSPFFRVFLLLLDRQAPAQRSSELSLHFLKVTVTAIVCLLPSSKVKPPRQAAQDATLTERRAELWAGVYGPTEKNTPHILRVTISLFRPIMVLSCFLETRSEHTNSQLYIAFTLLLLSISYLGQVYTGLQQSHSSFLPFIFSSNILKSSEYRPSLKDRYFPHFNIP